MTQVVKVFGMDFKSRKSAPEIEEREVKMMLDTKNSEK